MTGYTLRGKGFNLIPDDAIGVYANNNNDPSSFVDRDDDSFFFDIVSKSSTFMVLQAKAAVEHAANNYLGTIVSADKSTVYWVNETRPLP